jgi:hypothetical protein
VGRTGQNIFARSRRDFKEISGSKPEYYVVFIQEHIHWRILVRDQSNPERSYAVATVLYEPLAYKVVDLLNG